MLQPDIVNGSTKDITDNRPTDVVLITKPDVAYLCHKTLYGVDVYSYHTETSMRAISRDEYNRLSTNDPVFVPIDYAIAACSFFGCSKGTGKDNAAANMLRNILAKQYKIII